MRHTLIKRRRFNDDECDDDVWLGVLISSSESSEHVLLTKLISRVNLLRRWRRMVCTESAPHRSPLHARRTRLVGALVRWMGRSVYESWPPLLHHWVPSSDIFFARVRTFVLSFRLMGRLANQWNQPHELTRHRAQSTRRTNKMMAL